MDLSWLIRGGGSSSLSSEATSFSAKGRLVHRRSRSRALIRSLDTKIVQDDERVFFFLFNVAVPINWVSL